MAFLVRRREARRDRRRIDFIATQFDDDRLSVRREDGAWFVTKPPEPDVFSVREVQEDPPWELRWTRGEQVIWTGSVWDLKRLIRVLEAGAERGDLDAVAALQTRDTAIREAASKPRTAAPLDDFGAALTSNR